MRKFVSLSTFLIAVAAYADSANVRISVNALPGGYHAGNTLYVNATVFNDGPDTARHVLVNMEVSPVIVMAAGVLPDPTPPCPNGCRVGDVKPGASADLPQFVHLLPKSDFLMEITPLPTTSSPGTPAPVSWPAAEESW